VRETAASLQASYGGALQGGTRQQVQAAMVGGVGFFHWFVFVYKTCVAMPPVQ